MTSALESWNPQTTRAKVAANLAAELERQRWTGRKAAAALGLTQPYISRRVSGEVELSASDLEMFSKFLHVPVTQFYLELPDLDSNQEPAGFSLAALPAETEIPNVIDIGKYRRPTAPTQHARHALVTPIGLARATASI